MSQKTDKIEADLLACCYLDPEVIDRALTAGVMGESFANIHYAEQWRFLCYMRLAGKPIAVDTVYSEALSGGKLDAIGGIDGIMAVSAGVPTTAHAASHIGAVLTTAALRSSWRLLVGAVDGIKAGTANLDDVKAVGEQVAAICAGEQRVSRSLSDVADEAIAKAEEKISGKTATRTLITTGLPMFDKYASPIESHEYVVVGARTSHGKTSFMMQVAGHNVARGLKVAIFPLETSDCPTLELITGQRAGVCIKKLHEEMPAKQKSYMEKLRYAKTTKNLLIFDKDLTLTSIESRCRLLATNYKPDLVIIDYMGLIGTNDRDTYQRLTNVSKAMIPLRKMLGCALMLGAQFSRETEKEKREPTRTDFRDCGGIEEDMSRGIALWREPDQPLDNDWFNGAILQLKCRDGGLARIPIRFHGPTQLFHEHN